MQQEGAMLPGSLALGTTRIISCSQAEMAAEAALHLSQAVCNCCQQVALNAAQGSHSDADANLLPLSLKMITTHLMRSSCSMCGVVQRHGCSWRLQRCSSTAAWQQLARTMKAKV